MKKKLLIGVVALVCSAFAACTNSISVDVPIIEMPSEIEASAFEQNIRSIDLIPLSADRYLGGQLDMEIHNGDYIIADRRAGAVCRFSPEGKYLNDIGNKGNGPADFVDILNIQCLEEEIIVYSSPNKAVYYDYDGNHIRTEEGAFGAQNYKIGSDYLAYYGYQLEGSPRLALVKGDVKDEKYLVTEKRVMPLQKDAPVFSETKSGITVIDSYSDLLYLYSDGNLTPYLKFDFGRYAIDPSFYDSDDVFKGAMKLMSSDFAVISSYYEQGKIRIAEINLQTPKTMEKVYAYRNKGDWRWFSCGEMGKSAFAGAFVCLNGKYAYFLLDPSMAKDVDEGIRSKMGNPQVLDNLTADSNYVIAKVVFD